MVDPVPDPVLTRFRVGLAALYGDPLERAVLFGSRARGEARPDSDYDVAVFLRDMPDRWEDMTRLADLSTDFLGQTGESMRATPYRAETYADHRMPPLMHEIGRQGVDL